MFTESFPYEVFLTQKEFIRVMEAPRDFVFWVDLIDEETNELIKAHQEEEGMEQIFKEAADLLYVVCGFYNTMPPNCYELISDEANARVQQVFERAVSAFGEIISNYVIPPALVIEAFQVVHQSNMSKLDDNGQPIRSDGTDGNPKGKILKGPNYVAPSMAPVVMKWDKYIQQLKDQGMIEDAAEGN
ncbi:nucleotide pyrophosphohydrolase [Roseobacter phage RD-1410W1-01]|uniref:Nucleoside triphosphate pyrophosphohydrolase n=1 Tax=Roseobacter phage RD-1410W1-01 TaxID=1815984 RepID=A0A191VYJ0_9CAUD|nr:nucleotide pyrophosphohydrolase [Roseobacter phage RD-1410W1-01]ANJ20776.1 nucleoside triphosphate pyrophosphohydrolase [Roseobacter phage RD-1410W1-01]